MAPEAITSSRAEVSSVARVGRGVKGADVLRTLLSVDMVMLWMWPFCGCGPSVDVIILWMWSFCGCGHYVDVVNTSPVHPEAARIQMLQVQIPKKIHVAGNPNLILQEWNYVRAYCTLPSNRSI